MSKERREWLRENLNDDIRELAKWLNEEPNRPVDRVALARCLTELQAFLRLKDAAEEKLYYEGERRD